MPSTVRPKLVPMSQKSVDELDLDPDFRDESFMGDSTSPRDTPPVTTRLGQVYGIVIKFGERERE